MPSSIVCLDASFVLRLLLSASPEAPAVKMWCQGQEQGKTFAAPGLLYYEVGNALHRYTVRQQLTANEAGELLELALALNLELDHEPELHCRALRLAAELALPAAYDAHYVALAQRLGAELWTADQRLARAASGVVALMVVP